MKIQIKIEWIKRTKSPNIKLLNIKLLNEITEIAAGPTLSS